MRVARLIIYEGTPEAIQFQLGRSRNEGTVTLPSGVLNGGTFSITVVNVSAGLQALIDAAARELAQLQGAESLAQEIHADMAADARRERGR